MAKNKNVEISLEEKLRQALVPVDEQPYAIPSNWVWTRLGEIVALDNGENIENEELDYFDVKTLRRNLDMDIDADVVKKTSGRIVEKNDLVILVDGENSGEVFKIPYRGYMGSTFKKLKYNKEEMWNYISLFLKRNKEVFKNNKVGSAIPHLNKKLFKEFPFPLPPLNEQKRIVEKLDFLFEKTKRTKEIIEEIKIDIENRKISILDRAFKGTLTSKWRNENKTSDVKELLKSINEEKIKKWEEDCLQAEKDGNKKPKKPTITEVKDMIVPVDEQPYKLPDSWVWVRLGDIIRYTDNLDINKHYSSEQIINYIDIDSINNKFNYIEKVKKEKVKDLSSRARRVLKKDFILYSSVRPYLNNFAIMQDELEDCIGSTGFFVFKPIIISTLYIFRIFLVPYIKELYLSSIKGFNSPSINVEIFNTTPIPLPPLEEQQEIVRVLDEVLENENKVKELLELEERIDILEKSILHKAFKGELGTQNSSDESAMELLKNSIAINTKI